MSGILLWGGLTLIQLEGTISVIPAKMVGSVLMVIGWILLIVGR